MLDLLLQAVAKIVRLGTSATDANAFSRACWSSVALSPLKIVAYGIVLEPRMEHFTDCVRTTQEIYKLPHSISNDVALPAAVSTSTSTVLAASFGGGRYGNSCCWCWRRKGKPLTVRQSTRTTTTKKQRYASAPDKVLS